MFSLKCGVFKAYIMNSFGFLMVRLENIQQQLGFLKKKTLYLLETHFMEKHSP